MGVARLFDAGTCTRCTQAAIASNAKLMLQILEGAGSAMYGFANLSLGNRSADTDVHGILREFWRLFSRPQAPYAPVNSWVR